MILSFLKKNIFNFLPIKKVRLKRNFLALRLFGTVQSACKINYFTHFVIILINNFSYRKQPSE